MIVFLLFLFYLFIFLTFRLKIDTVVCISHILSIACVNAGDKSLNV